jgi:G3E family GTPase
MDEPLDGPSFDAWLSGFLQTRGPDVFRYKGVLQFAGSPDRVLLQGVHMMAEHRAGRPWEDGVARATELVFIGRELDRGDLEAGLRACAA